ncbi:MAG TPA: hypothetical protein VJV78_22610 [Polyangiales bacterium]|nr:hypothetical protein [Polyangiales bacterium]
MRGAGTSPARRSGLAALLLMAAASTVAHAEPPRSAGDRWSAEGSRPSGASLPEPDAIYGYTDDHGRIVHVQRLEDVPLRLRDHARRLDQEPSLLDLWGKGPQPGKPVVLYRYRTLDGRTKYTNLRDSVPAAQRAGAEVDLSRVSLNTDVGRDLDRRLNEEFSRLAEQPACQQLRAAADRDLLQIAWQEHGPLVVCGGAILLLVFFTPSMVRRVGGPAWSKTIGMAVPILAVVGIFAYTTVRSNHAMEKLKQQAEPCQAETWNALAQNDHGLVERYKLLQGMRTQQSAFAQIAAEGR